MYSRADKSVGYATPAYMADHACNSTELRFDMSVNLDVDKLRFRFAKASVEDATWKPSMVLLISNLHWVHHPARCRLQVS